MVTIYHNPRCSKSRQTLELLQNNNVDPQIVLYLQNPLSKGEIQTLLTKLNMTAADIVRTKEKEFKELGLDVKTSSDEEILDGIISCPKLLERPIVVNNEKAVIGRPPENILQIL